MAQHDHKGSEPHCIEGVVDIRSLPLGGRVRYGAEGIARRHLFGSVATPTPSQLDYQAFTLEAGAREVCLAEAHCPRTWVVSLTGQEIQRSVSEGALSALPFSAFDGPPAGAQLVPRTQLKFAISAQLDSGTRRFFADAGQSFEVQANRICMSWLAPANFVEVNDNLIATAGSRAGFVIDSLLGGSAAAIETCIGNGTLSFTTHVYVPLETRATIIVPAFATEVTIYQAATLGNAAVMWEQRYGDPNILTSIEAGPIPFLVGQRRTQLEQVIPDVTHFQTDIDIADRWFTLRWTIRP